MTPVPPPETAVRPRLVVMDVMPLLYRGHFAFLGKPRFTASGFNSSALFVFANTVREMLAERGATHAALVMDSSPTFRHEMYPQYKAQREKLPEDIAASVAPAEEFARALRVPFLRVEGFEADDLMGTLSALGERAGFETWVVTPDKDMAQLVTENTLLCRPGHGADGDEMYDVAKVREEWGVDSPALMVDYLGMAGDSADNIPGFPGVGPKTARDLLARFGSLDGVIANASAIKGRTGERIAANAELARMSRRLAEIRRDVPLPCSLGDLKLREPDMAALGDFCRRYEFSKLLSKFTGSSGAAAPGGGPAVLPEPPAAALDTAETAPHVYHVVAEPGGLRALAEKLKAADCFAFDTETAGLDPRSDPCVGLSFCIEPGEAWYVAVAREDAASAQSAAQEPVQLDLFSGAEPAPEEKTAPEGVTAAEIREILGPVFADARIAKTGHNVKFDLHVLRGLGVETAGPLSDSMLAHYVIDPTLRHGMDPLAREYLRYDPIPIAKLIGPRGKERKSMAAVPLAEIAEYAAEDADVTMRLHRALEPAVRECGAWRAYAEAENPLIRVLADMEDEGVRIDVGALAGYGRELGAEMECILRRVYELAGGEFNVDSPQQLGRVLFEKLGLPGASRTSTGHFSTAEDVLQDLRERHEIVPLVLDYRACAKLKSTYVDRLPQCIDPRDGRVHTTFQQALTETGRLSSDNPNLQNIPVRTERGRRIRAAILPSGPGRKLLSADYSQIELRMVAHLSGDEALVEAFRSGADIHRETAARVYGVDPADVTKEQRSFCKQVNFGIIYGMSAFGLSQRIGCSRAHADELIKAYFEMFPGVRAYLDRTIAAARENGFVSTMLGRRRPLRDISSRNATVRSSAERNATNTPVQGSAADLMKLAMVRVHAALRGRGLSARLVLQVHDELVLDVPENEIETATALVRDAMENAMALAVPLRVDVGVGDNWLAAH